MRFALALGLAAAIAAVVAASARSTSHAVPRGFRPETAAAVGTRDYWVLGEYRCGSSWCNALVRSMDAGGHFARVDLPPLPSQGNVPSLAFASARVGYLVGRGGRLYVTHDGGSSWLLSAPAGVRNVAVGGGDVYVIAGRNRYERSPIARRSWHAVSLPVRFRFLVSLAARGRSVWLLGSTRHIRAGDVDLRSADHGATFTRSHAPCIPELAGKLVPAEDGVVWAVCPTGMMGGALRVDERRPHVPRVPFVPRSGRRPSTGVDERRRDLSELYSGRRPLSRRVGAAVPHNRPGTALDARTANRSVRTALPAQLRDESGRRRSLRDTVAREPGVVLANDRRRHNLAFRADSVVKRRDEPPERGRVNRGRRRMISA
jgi:hypothetical protein